jgi:hypothetical protein
MYSILPESLIIPEHIATQLQSSVQLRLYQLLGVKRVLSQIRSFTHVISELMERESPFSLVA